MSQPQPRHGARRAFGIINANSTPRKASKGGASAIADEVLSAKKEKQSNIFSSMATRSSKKRAASLKEADEKEVVAEESPSKKTAITNAVLPKAAKDYLKEEVVGEEYSKEVFRTLPEVDATFWDEMEDLLEIKLANPIGSQDEFDANSHDGYDDNDGDKLPNIKEKDGVADDV